MLRNELKELKNVNVCRKGHAMTPPPPQQSGVGVITLTALSKVGKYVAYWHAKKLAKMKEHVSLNLMLYYFSQFINKMFIFQIKTKVHCRTN